VNRAVGVESYTPLINYKELAMTHEGINTISEIIVVVIALMWVMFRR
jgi:hypothetical protein